VKILVDADACPVKEIIVSCGREFEVPVIMFIDTSHFYDDGTSLVVQVDTASDSVDIAMANRVERGDICVTQDYGLAALLLGKGARVINQNGFIYTNENIERLLFERHISREMRKAGKRGGKIKKRGKENDERFEICLRKLLGEMSLR